MHVHGKGRGPHPTLAARQGGKARHTGSSHSSQGRGQSSEHGPSSGPASSGSVDTFLAGHLSALQSKFTTPASSAPPSPSPSEVVGAYDTVVEWAAAEQASRQHGFASYNEVRGALETLANFPQRGHAGQAYDAVLHLLASGALSQEKASDARVHVQNNAEARVAALYLAMREPLTAAHPAPTQRTLQLLRRLKLSAVAKQQVLAMLAPQGALPPSQVAVSPPTWSPGAPLRVEKQRFVAQAAQAFQALGPPSAGVHPLGAWAAPAIGCASVSVLCLAVTAGCSVGAAVAVMGPTIAYGGYAKIKQVQLLPAGVAALRAGGQAGDSEANDAALGAPQRFVARQTVASHDQDAMRTLLRGDGFRPLKPTSPTTRDNEAEAQRIASSELVPQLQFIDAKGRQYDIIPARQGSVAQVLQDRPLLRRNGAFVSTLLADILPPLARLHAQHWAHFDVKPDNVLLGLAATGAPVATLADYGLARKINEQAHTVRGTYRYMAPEMLLQNGQGITAKADVFALSVALAEILAPKELLRTLFNLPSKDALRADLHPRDWAHVELAGHDEQATEASLVKLAAALHVEKVSATYSRWYRARIEAPEQEVRGRQLGRSSQRPVQRPRAATAPGDVQSFAALDALHAACRAESPAFAAFIMRGLHANPDVRDGVDAWQAALAAAPKPTAEQRAAMAGLLAQSSEASEAGRIQRQTALALDAAAKELAG